ncbi:hypothetical protein EDI_005180 [Entamoeba dispar SAW760]|uniref:LRR containing protein n=1 Tax=Entamoeba dispar (strain ATCC PRA-260 / SAW760) TaxID=370354 RepID=B0EA07_ENTDS|nr:uncharacterized protein EDI_005180 [Entamoeba dispar SAW760]EDR28620.1 hypothetical protein EDI_005180 [Entamoeba dispar SAW760]|eukprot:EDR28620.1 hypothetical protein EDI_005180 [Entamoeba dispar SAW760]
MTQLSIVHLANVVLYLNSTTAFQTFIKVNSRCKEAVKMIRINPPKVLLYAPFLFNNIPNINTIKLDALNAQRTFTHQELERISWIDSSEDLCQIEFLNEFISQKIVSLKIHCKDIKHLYKFKNIRKLIVVELKSFDKMEFAVLKSQNKLEKIILYFKKINCKIADFILRESRYLKAHFIIIYDSPINCQLIGNSKVQFYLYNNLVLPSQKSSKEDLKLKRELTITKNDINQLKFENCIDGIDLTSIINLKIDCNEFLMTKINTSEMNNLKDLSIRIFKKSKFNLYLSNSIQNLSIDAEKSHVNIIGIDICNNFQKVSLKCRIKTNIQNTSDNSSILKIKAKESINIICPKSLLQIKVKVSDYCNVYIDASFTSFITSYSWASSNITLINKYCDSNIYILDTLKGITLCSPNHLMTMNATESCSNITMIGNFDTITLPDELQESQFYYIDNKLTSSTLKMISQTKKIGIIEISTFFFEQEHLTCSNFFVKTMAHNFNTKDIQSILSTFSIYIHEKPEDIQVIYGPSEVTLNLSFIKQKVQSLYEIPSFQKIQVKEHELVFYFHKSNQQIIHLINKQNNHIEEKHIKKSVKKFKPNYKTDEDDDLYEYEDSEEELTKDMEQFIFQDKDN